MADALTVTQFNNLVSVVLKNNSSIHDIIVVGEITGLKRASSGHLYFDLKDQNSLIHCTLFRFAASRLKFVPKDGMKVNVFGGASFYEVKGSLSFNVESMAEFGKGDNQAALEALAAKFLAEGLFDPERKKKLPKYPRVIGVVTSATGAVIKDIIDTTARRFPVDILLAPATVQGEDAPKSIVHGIELLNQFGVDVIIVGRGGGSNDDLSAFNDESVVRAVANSKIPTISAVGHATDKSFTDRVADVYAETPTAAAMLATPDKEDETKNVFNLMRRLSSSLTSISMRKQSQFNKLDGKLSPKIFGSRVEILRTRFDECTHRIYNSVKQMENRHNQNQLAFDRLDESMDGYLLNIIEGKKHRLELQSKLLSGLDPKGVLGRGYSFVTDSEGRVLTSVSSITQGDDITVSMRDGKVEAKVKGVEKK